jgi:hypothetical protein
MYCYTCFPIITSCTYALHTVLAMSCPTQQVRMLTNDWKSLKNWSKTWLWHILIKKAKQLKLAPLNKCDYCVGTGAVGKIKREKMSPWTSESVKSSFYEYSGSEHDEQNILKLELVLSSETLRLQLNGCKLQISLVNSNLHAGINATTDLFIL